MDLNVPFLFLHFPLDKAREKRCSINHNPAVPKAIQMKMDPKKLSQQSFLEHRTPVTGAVSKKEG
jgi:hypothetical protein